MVAWDRRSPRALARQQDEAVAAQARDVLIPGSPLWRERLRALNRTAESLRTVADLATVPALAERDVSPTGDPAGMAALVVQAGERGFTSHAPGAQLRHALVQRLVNRDRYRRIVDADTRATTFISTGLGFRYPIASTRSDLDLVARAGARLWSVLGLTRDDVLLSAVPPGPTVEHQTLSYAALAAGAPAVFPGADPADVAAAVRLTPPTVVAADRPAVLPLLETLRDSDVSSVRTLVVTGVLDDAARQAIHDAALSAGAAADVVVLAIHAPAGARVMWGECRESLGSTGLHSYPDLEVVQTVDADTGDLPSVDGGELVLTQLGWRGSALFRWRTGDVVAAIEADRCPACRRTVPRLIGVQPGALVVPMASASGAGAERAVDLRAVAGALVGRTHLQDWRIVVGNRRRDGNRQVVVYVAETDDESSLAVAVATDLRAVAGTLPTQLVVSDRESLNALPGTPLSKRILVDSGTGAA